MKYFELRGLCGGLSKLVDTEFFIDVEAMASNVEAGIEFTGLIRSRLILDKASNRWTIYSMREGKKIISLDYQVHQREDYK